MKKGKGSRRVASIIGFLLLAALVTGCGKDNWKKELLEETIIVEGLEKEYELLFLTDSHVIVLSGEETDQVRQNAEPRAAMFQDEEGMEAASQFAHWIDYANEEQVDGVLLGGDIIDFPSIANLDFLDEELDKLKMPFVYTLGNHDWTYPWEYMTEQGARLYLPELREYLDGNEAIHVTDFGEFLVVAVDNSSNQIHDAALEKYEELIAQGKPMLVLLHVPLMTQSVLSKAKEVWSSGVVLGAGNFGGIYPDGESERFMQLTTSENSPVIGVLAGHVHFSDKDMIDGEKKVLQIVGGAGYEGCGVMLHLTGGK